MPRRRSSRSAPVPPTPWTVEEDEKLREAVACGLSCEFWGVVLPHRTFGDIATRRVELNLKLARLI